MTRALAFYLYLEDTNIASLYGICGSQQWQMILIWHQLHCVVIGSVGKAILTHSFIHSYKFTLIPFL
jgi:hypothetical protein